MQSSYSNAEQNLVSNDFWFCSGFE